MSFIQSNNTQNSINNNSSKNEIEKLEKDNIRLIKENNSLQSENEKLRNRIHNLENEIIFKTNNYNLKIKELNKTLTDKNNKIKNLSDEIKNLKIAVTNKNNEINNLNNEINNLKLNNNNKKNRYIREDEILIIQFKSIDQKVDMPFSCKNTDIFVSIEQLLYNEYPEYKDLNTYFTVNGRIVKRFRNFQENNIKNKDKILLNIYE